MDTSVHNRVPRCPLLRTATAKSWLISTTRRLLSICPLSSAQNHNGGAIHFGTDGKLYVAVGENTRPWAAHSLNTTLGKMLRINKDGSIPDGTDGTDANRSTHRPRATTGPSGRSGSGFSTFVRFVQRGKLAV